MATKDYRLNRMNVRLDGNDILTKINAVKGCFGNCLIALKHQGNARISRSGHFFCRLRAVGWLCDWS